MAKKDNETTKEPKFTPLNRSLYKISQKILSLIDSNYEYDNELEAKNMKFQQVINRELDLANGVSHGSIVDFVQAQREKNQKDMSSDSSTFSTPSSNIFTENIDQIYNYLVELYDNKYMEMLDLKYICKFIPVLGQALKTHLNQVCTADDIAEGVKRKIDFDIQVDDNIRSMIESTIGEFETNNKFLQKLKNFTFRNTLTVGSSYIYRISYKELFEQYEEKRRSNAQMQQHRQFGMAASTEAVTAYDEAYRDALESVNKIINTIPNSTFGNGEVAPKKNFVANTESEIKEIFDSFHVNTDCILSSAMESANAYMAIKSMSGLQDGMRPSMEAKMAQYQPVADGVADPSGQIKKKSEGKGNFDINGSYVKFIESRDIVPLKIFNDIVGYYHIVSKKKKKSKTTRTTNGGLFATSLEASNQKKEKAMDAIVDSISGMIMKNFNQKFLEENQEFKKVIADCILAKGIADNEYSIQFIPAKYIYAFKINETIDGQGESMLSESLLPGKMLLSYLVAKLVLFVNNSGDKTLVTTHRGQIDLNGKNQIDRVVRQLEGQTISFGDFLSPNIMFNKFNRNTNIMIPTALNGQKMLEFEKLEGKDINMQTEMEEKLEKMAMIGSGVPDSVMEYTNDLQFSRQIVSSSIKYAGDISSIQSDLESPLTDLYRDVCLDSNLSDEVKRYIPHMIVTLPRPRVITNGNNNENIRTSKESAEMIAEMYFGADPKETDNEARKKFILELCKDTVTYFDWTKVDEIYNKVNISSHGPKENIDTSDSDSGSEF